MSRRPLLALLTALVGSAAPARDADRFRLDATSPHFARVNWDSAVASADANPDEYQAYCDVVRHALRFPTADLLRAGDRLVTPRDLLLPAGRDWQFRLLAFDGRLKKARRIQPPKPLVEEGVADLYECWLFPARSDSPMCFLAAELPPGLAPSLDYTPARPVTVAGYLFKRLHYESREEDPANPARPLTRKAPLLIGRSFALTDLPPTGPSPGAWWTGFAPGILAVVGGLAAAAGGLTWWFRRGDRATRRALDDRRAVNPFES